MTPTDSCLHPIFNDEERAVTPVMIINLTLSLDNVDAKTGTTLIYSEEGDSQYGSTKLIFVAWGAKTSPLSLYDSTERTVTATRGPGHSLFLKSYCTLRDQAITIC